MQYDYSDISSPELEDQLLMTLDQNVNTFSEIADGHLKDSLLSCSTEQSMMPLIKQELKLKIQNRRLSEGKQELEVRFTPPPVYKLTPQEEVKQEIRKERNRKSAVKSREKRKEHEDQLVQQCKELEKQHADLKEMVEKYKDTERFLRGVLVKHLLKCPKYNEKVKRLKKRLRMMTGAQLQIAMTGTKVQLAPHTVPVPTT